MRHVELRRVADAAAGGEADARFGGLDPDLVRALAVGEGDRRNRKAYRADPPPTRARSRKRPRSSGVLLTGSLRSPGLHEVADALGLEKVRRRARAVTGV